MAKCEAGSAVNGRTSSSASYACSVRKAPAVYVMAASDFAAFDARLRPGRMCAVPAIDVDLDLPPAERWAWATSYQQHFRSAQKLVLDGFGVDATRPPPMWIRASARAMLWAVPAGLREEVVACAAACDESPGELALLNYLYELKAKCSSFVVPRADGRPLHARTLDWPGCAVLCECTVRLRFLRDGKLLYEALSWPGYLGVLTACVPGRFSLSVNFREDERAQLPWGLPEWGPMPIVAEVLRRASASLAALAGGGRSVGFSVRQLLEARPTPDFEGAVAALSRAPLVAPVYFTLAGTAPGQVSRSSL